MANKKTDKKGDNKVKVLSPDGFEIDFSVDEYPNMASAKEAFENWKSQYEKQGYYSYRGHKIPLADLEYCCQFITIIEPQ